MKSNTNVSPVSSRLTTDAATSLKIYLYKIELLFYETKIKTVYMIHFPLILYMVNRFLG